MNSEYRFQILDSLLEGVQIHDFEYRYLYVNDALVSYSKYSREELIGFTVMEKYPGIENTEVFKAMERCMRSRKGEQLETDFVFPDGSRAFFDLSIQPIPEGISILSIDRTQQNNFQQRLIKGNRLYAFISAINQSIVHINNEQELLDNACRVAVNIGKFKMAWVNRVDEEKGVLTMIHVRGTNDIEKSGIKNSGLKLNDPTLQDTPTGRALRNGTYAISNDVLNDPSMQVWKKELEENGIRSFMSLALKKIGMVTGTIGFFSGVEQFFDEAEVTLLVEAVNDLSFSLDNFEKNRIHKATELLIKENESRFRALIEKSMDMKTLATREGILTYVSPSMLSILGYTIEELIGISLFTLIHPDDLEKYKRKINEILDVPGASFSFNQRRLSKSRNWVWCEGTVTNFLHEPGIMAMVSNFMDISEKKAAEQQREFDRKNLDALINNTNDLMWSVDRKFKLITSNKPFESAIEHSGREIKKGAEVLGYASSAEHASRFRTAYERVFKGEAFIVVEYSAEPPESWFEISFSPIWKDREIIGAACHGRNITERKLAENLLRKALKELVDYKRAIDEASIVAITNQKGIITHINDNFCRISQYQGHELIGQDHRLVNSSYHSKEFIRSLWRTIASGKVWRGELRNKARDGSYYWVGTTIVPFLDEDQKPYQYIAIRSDLTARKLAEEELILKNDELHKANVELDRFVYSASHDLRSPLASILGLLHFIERESLEPATLDYAKMIRHGINRLDEFIKNILNHSRNRRAELEFSEIGLRSMIHSIIDGLRNMKEAAGIELIIDVDESCPFYSDPQRLSIILENLVSNAMKFRNESRSDKVIRISAIVYREYLDLRVEDNGIGIPEEYHEKIFNMFFRLSNKNAGSGIGLYIVKETIRKLEGSIAISSTPELGTCFSIQIKNFGATDHL